MTDCPDINTQVWKLPSKFNLGMWLWGIPGITILISVTDITFMHTIKP
jgi:hypothetical protein